MGWAVLAADGGPDFTDINLATAIWTWVAFVVTYVVLSKVAWPRLVATIEARELRIAEGLERAAEAEARAEELRALTHEVLDEARKEAHQMLTAARAAAEHEANAVLRAGQAELAEQRKRAKEGIRQERSAALEELKVAATELALLTAGRLLKRDLSREENRRLADELVGDVARRLEVA